MQQAYVNFTCNFNSKHLFSTSINVHFSLFKLDLGRQTANTIIFQTKRMKLFQITMAKCLNLNICSYK